jgi:hypothetical protein
VCVGEEREREREKKTIYVCVCVVYTAGTNVCVGEKEERERERKKTYVSSVCMCVECELYVGKTTTAITTHRFFAPHRQTTAFLSSFSLATRERERSHTHTRHHAPKQGYHNTDTRSSNTHTHTDSSSLSLELLSLSLVVRERSHTHTRHHAPKQGYHRRSSHTHILYIHTYIYIMMFTRLTSCSSLRSSSVLVNRRCVSRTFLLIYSCSSTQVRKDEREREATHAPPRAKTRLSQTVITHTHILYIHTSYI